MFTYSMAEGIPKIFNWIKVQRVSWSLNMRDSFTLQKVANDDFSLGIRIIVH